MRIHIYIALALLMVINFVFGKKCHSQQFQCQTGDQCIAAKWRCDNDFDCEDKSDEKDCIYPACNDKQYRCKSKKCISKTELCDDFPDCPDKDDESPALCQINCNASHFVCTRGLPKCIPLKQKCDGHVDCADKSDESIFNCNFTPHDVLNCAKDEFTCKGGGCVQNKYVCDGKKDCLDGSDEANSTCKGKPHGCGTEYFQCVSDKKCVLRTSVCNGLFDCADHSDEKQCQSISKINPVRKCEVDEFRCQHKCIPESWRCDGENDCNFNEDERDCSSTTCEPPKFPCNTGNKCIHPKQLCDGVKDCDDNSDEINCQKKPNGNNCDKKTHFRCPSSIKGALNGEQCISWKKVCDNITHCVNGEDEIPGGNANNCKLNPCKSASCTQNCENHYTRAVCSCKPGFKLLEDKATCDDINECREWGSCSQNCINTKGSFKCSCDVGYELYTTRKGKGRCRANGDPSLIFATQENIRFLRLKEREERSIVSDLVNVGDLDYDAKAKTIFWSQPTPPAVFTANIEKSGQPKKIEVYSDGNSVPEGLGYDWVHNLMYMTDTGLKRIIVVNMTSPSKKATVIAMGNKGDEPRGIVVDPLEGWLYWTDWGHRAKISKIGMNGQFHSVLVSDNIVLPNSLTLDRTLNRLFWSDAKLHAIYSVDVNGGDRRLIFQDGYIYPYSMAVFEDRVFWSDWQSDSVSSVEKFTGENFKKLVTSHRISAIRVMHLLNQPDVRNRCKNHVCSHVCLPTPNVGGIRTSPKYTCGCPEDMELQNDDRTCAFHGSSKTRSDSSSISSTTSLPTPASSVVTTPRVPASKFHSVVSTTASAVTSTVSANIRVTGRASISKVTAPSQDPHAPKTPRVTFKAGPNMITTRKPIELNGERQVGHVAGIVIGIFLLLTVVCGSLMLLLYRAYSRKNMRSMNFDNPVYRKPTLEGDSEAQFPINSTLGLTTVNNSARAPIWNGGIVNGAVEA